MSRRKQAKPRAFLKLGETGDAASEEQQMQQPPQPIDLLDPKEEIVSDDNENASMDELDDDDEEDECQRQQGQQEILQNEQQHLSLRTVATKNDNNSISNGNNNILANIDRATNKTSKNKNINSNDNNNIIGGSNGDTFSDASKKPADVENNVKAAEQNLQNYEDDEMPIKRSENFLVDEELPNDVFDDEEDLNDIDATQNEPIDEIDEDDVYEDDLDLQSLDSFYSDIYSTHTSSSYSPSISDGTMTPNSLHMQHQHHHHHHHQHPHLPPQHQQHMPHDEDAAGRPPRRQRVNIDNNGNGNGELNVGEGAEDDDENADNLSDKKPSRTEATRLNGDADITAAEKQQQQQHGRNRLGRCRTGLEHGIKIPTKLRKIDRDSAKFDKMTSDGIKSGNAATTDGSYQCQFCDKSFPRLGYLKKHEQSHAEHLPFKCDYCARLFKHKRSRDRHTKLHTGDRRYRCPHCEAAFSRSDHLKIHMKTHDNQKPFQCTICNRGYNTAAALTSHMQNHKKQAAILAAGGNPQALNYSPRSTGSASSNGSLHKRRYAMASVASDSSPSRLEYPKRLRSNFLTCTYCPKNDFTSLEQLNTHIKALHEKDLIPPQSQTPTNNTELQSFQLACEYCTMKFPNLPAMFQHMRSTHIDRLTSPNSYFEHFNRLAATGTFSPRLIPTNKSMQRPTEENIKIEQNLSPKTQSSQEAKQEEPTDLSQNKRRSVTPISPISTPMQNDSPQTPEKPGIFFCNQCNAGLPDFESFRNHLKSHIVQGAQLICHHCGLTLRDQSEYERHVISHFLITNSEFNCDGGNCNKSFVKPEELQKHLLDTHVVTVYKCALCSELFETKVAIQVHFACAHSQETKLLRCSACMDVFRTEHDFNTHVKTRHQVVNGSSSAANNNSSLQCMFCRTVCASDLEMHFHLAAHARQFRCPSCPETFHVEFLLDRHMQSHHSGNERAPTMLPPSKDNYEDHSSPVNANNGSNNQLSPMNSLYVNAIFGKTPLMPLAAQNNNNNILDYNVAFAAQLNKGLFPSVAAAAVNAGKFYSPLQVDTSGIKHPALMYGLGQRYFDTNRTLIDMYNQHHQDKNSVVPNSNTYFISPKHSALPPAQEQTPPNIRKTPSDIRDSLSLNSGFSCGMCERNDFRTEAELHSHRKIVHNMKTGVSLRCAYCSGNFKSRSELEHHMKTCHNSTGKHKCLICDEIFPSPAILAEHKLQHSKVGQSGKCSHCAKPLNDVAAFKAHLTEHNTEGQMPVQCICCRQSLHSDFEIGLHAKFHTKSSNAPEAICALCLEPIPNAPSETKVCEKCCRKHNLNNKFNKNRENYERANNEQRHYIENRCNLCKMILPHPQKLQEHLVEHTFAGCEDRGFICYICSAVFTAPAGLLNHMTEHGLNARPYDCNLCSDKFYFRAELDHHLVDHELREIMVKEQRSNSRTSEVEEEQRLSEQPSEQQKQQNAEMMILSNPTTAVKKEIFENHNKNEAGEEDDEYIEVEKVPELANIHRGGHTECVDSGENLEKHTAE